MKNAVSETILAKAAKIKLVVFDVDGVLTDGKIYFTDEGVEYKAFNSQDGLGIKLLLNAGIEVGIITARTSKIVQKRMGELGVQHIYQGQENKIHSYEQLKTNLKLNHDEIAYVGDDLNDLPLLRRSGFGVAVANASSILFEHADWRTQHTGGAGAVREVCELILTAQNQLENICEQYL